MQIGIDLFLKSLLTFHQEPSWESIMGTTLCVRASMPESFFSPLLKVSKGKSFVSIVCPLYPAANSHEDLTHFHAQEIQLDNFRLFVKILPLFTLYALKSSIQYWNFEAEKLWLILTNIRIIRSPIFLCFAPWKEKILAKF